MRERGEIPALFLLHGIKNNYNKTLEKVLIYQLGDKEKIDLG